MLHITCWAYTNVLPRARKRKSYLLEIKMLITILGSSISSPDA